MSQIWYDNSEKNLGLIIRKDQSSFNYSPDDFYPESFPDIVRYIQENEDWDITDLYRLFPTAVLDASQHAVVSMNGAGKDVNWPAILKDSKRKYELGSEFERLGKSLKRGDEPELLHIRSDLDALACNQSLGAEKASEIDLTEVADLQPSGWKEIDETFGGMPLTGPLILYGTMGTGKSFCTSKYVKEFLKYYPERRAGVYSLEMSNKRYLKRTLSMYPDIHDVLDRLWISGKAKNVEDIVAEASKEKFDLVVIDSIDYLPDKEISASVMDRLWKAIVRMGRLLEIPIIVTAQPNREAKWRARETFLQKYDIAWSGSSEDAAEQLIALQYVQDAAKFNESDFVAFDNSFYMICWKQRGGWPIQKGPGAIIFHKDDAIYNNENDRILWEGKVFQNMLWKAGANMRIGEKKESSRRMRIEEDD